jgi:hypothetical protein
VLNSDANLKVKISAPPTQSGYIGPSITKAILIKPLPDTGTFEEKIRDCR